MTGTAHLRLRLLVLGLLVATTPVSGFPSYRVRESIGGLVLDGLILEQRDRINRETRTQLGIDRIFSNFSSPEANLSLQCPSESLTFTQNPQESLQLGCNLTYSTKTPLAISSDIDIHQVASLLNQSWVYLAPGEAKAIPLDATIQRSRMGSAYLNVWVREALSGGVDGSIHPWDMDNATLVQDYTSWLRNPAATDRESPPVMGFHLKVLRARGVMEVIFRIVVAVLVCGITFFMGCELDVRLIMQHLRKPVGPIIGFFCQFGLMPLIAFGIASVVPIKPEFGFGLLTTGCCPGGGGSNIWTLLLHGDLNLSMTMTFISSVAALGMMPLMLLIYGRFFLDVATIKIPYLQIAGQLCYVVIPVVLGMLLKWRRPRWAAVMARMLRPMAFFFLVTIIGFGTYINLPIYGLLGEYPILIATAAALPWIGFLLAGVFAYICRRSRAEIMTISIETGIQNVGIAILVMIYSMPQPEGDVGAIMPLVVSIFTPLPLTIAVIILAIKEGRCCCCRQKNGDEKEVDNETALESPWGQGALLANDAHSGENKDSLTKTTGNGEDDNGDGEINAPITLDSKRGRAYSKEHIISAIISP